MAVKIDVKGRGTDFAMLEITTPKWHHIYTGKVANALLDAMDSWADLRTADEQRIVATKEKK